jgi:hypothetical protein
VEGSEYDANHQVDRAADGIQGAGDLATGLSLGAIPAAGYTGLLGEGMMTYAEADRGNYIDAVGHAGAFVARGAFGGASMLAAAPAATALTLLGGPSVGIGIMAEAGHVGSSFAGNIITVGQAAGLVAVDASFGPIVPTSPSTWAATATSTTTISNLSGPAELRTPSLNQGASPSTGVSTGVYAPPHEPVINQGASPSTGIASDTSGPSQ